MKYQAYTPASELIPFVKCYWTLEDDANQEAARQRIVPDGCMELIIHFGDPYRQFFENGTSIIQPRAFVFGQITNYIEIAPTGNSGIIAARFLPDGLSPLIELHVSTLENKAVSLNEVFGDAGLELERSILKAKDIPERIRVLEKFLLDRLSEPRSIDTITKNCVDEILGSHGQLGMNELADKMNIHRRNIERKFTSVIGMSPKQLARVIRLQSTIRMLGSKDFTSLTSLAYENGYYDQAHFIRDFRDFTGMSPKSFFAENFRFASLFAAAE
jgi:AraC-like DNA-binding protein